MATGSHLVDFGLPIGSAARFAHSAGAVGNYALFAGGFTSDGVGSAVVDVLDRTYGYTFYVQYLSIPRGYLASARSGNLIKFAGGQSTNSGGVGTVSARIDTFDASLGTFLSTSQLLSVARSFLAAVSVPSLDMIVFAGGHNGSQVVDTIDIWTAANNSITQPTVLPTARHSLCTVAVGTRVFFGGGTNSLLVPTGVVEILDLATMTWSTASAPLSDGGRSYLVCSSFVAEGSNYVMFAGGVSPTSVSNVIDIYHENGTYITPTPALSTVATTTTAASTTTPASSTSTPGSTTTTTPQASSSTISSSTTPQSTTTTTVASTVATTTPAPTVFGGCLPPQPFPSSFCVNSTWSIIGSVVFSNNVTISVLSPVAVAGNVTIKSGANVTIAALNISSSSPIITASGCVRIDPNASLVLDLGKATPNSSQSITVLEASQTCGGDLGNFSSVQTKGGALQLCESLSSSQATSSTQLSVLLSVGKSPACRKKSNKIVIIVGCSAAAAVLLILLAILLYYATYVKRWLRCCDCMFRTRDEEERRESGSRRFMISKRMG